MIRCVLVSPISSLCPVYGEVGTTNTHGNGDHHITLNTVSAQAERFSRVLQKSGAIQVHVYQLLIRYFVIGAHKCPFHH